MQVGDLVTYDFQTTRWRAGMSVHVGLIIETGSYTGNCDVKVLWTGYSESSLEKILHLKLVDKSLTSS